MGEFTPSLIGPALTIGSATLLFIVKWLWDVKASQARIEAGQLITKTQVEKHSNEISDLRERTAGLEGAVFKRPPIREEI